MRFEMSNVNEKTVEEIRVWCVKNKKTQGEWCEMAHRALIGK